MPISRSNKRAAAIKRNQRKRASRREDDIANEAYHPLPDGDRGFVPRNQRNAVRDEQGRYATAAASGATFCRTSASAGL